MLFYPFELVTCFQLWKVHSHLQRRDRYLVTRTATISDLRAALALARAPMQDGS